MRFRSTIILVVLLLGLGAYVYWIEYPKAQEEAKKKSDKDEQDRKDKAAKQDDCARAKEAVVTLESGQRISRTNAAGERYFLDDDQRAQEVAKARQAQQQNCQ